MIGVFLAGIAAGNWIGAGDRFAIVGRRTLASVLLVGAVGTVWPIAFSEILQRTGVHRSLPLEYRIVVLSTIACFPAGLTLALLTPLAVRIGTADVRSAGRVAGMTFALGTLGCLLGNYATGFWLIPSFTINTIIFGVAGMLASLAVITLTLPIPAVGRTEEKKRTSHRFPRSVGRSPSFSHVALPG